MKGGIRGLSEENVKDREGRLLRTQQEILRKSSRANKQYCRQGTHWLIKVGSWYVRHSRLKGRSLEASH
jgi:hypothetical protein